MIVFSVVVSVSTIMRVRHPAVIQYVVIGLCHKISSENSSVESPARCVYDRVTSEMINHTDSDKTDQYSCQFDHIYCTSHNHYYITFKTVLSRF